jgi:flagellar assembly protein FliH
MHKVKAVDVKPFSFAELQGIKPSGSEDVQSFEFQSIEEAPFTRPKVDQQTIRTERKFEAQSEFRIDDAVRNSRGISGQEKDDFEKAITKQVEIKINEIKNHGYSEGFERGKEEAFQKKQLELEAVYEEKIQKVSDVILEVSKKSNDLLVTNKEQVLEFINRLSKWVILKEVSRDMYLEKLLEKLVLELNEKRNLIVKVGRSNFAEMPELISKVENRLGQLPNVRVEIVPEVIYPGIILESDNGLIDGSLETIFKNIDKIFEMVSSNAEG